MARLGSTLSCNLAKTLPAISKARSPLTRMIATPPFPTGVATAQIVSSITSPKSNLIFKNQMYSYILYINKENFSSANSQDLYFK